MNEKNTLRNSLPIELLLSLKKGKKIEIKKSHQGRFTEYCGGNVTNECISRGKNSSNPKIRKLAVFAENARKWKHTPGGRIKKAENSFYGALNYSGQNRGLGMNISGLLNFTVQPSSKEEGQKTLSEQESPNPSGLGNPILNAVTSYLSRLGNTEVSVNSKELPPVTAEKDSELVTRLKLQNNGDSSPWGLPSLKDSTDGSTVGRWLISQETFLNFNSSKLLETPKPKEINPTPTPNHEEYKEDPNKESKPLKIPYKEAKDILSNPENYSEEALVAALESVDNHNIKQTALFGENGQGGAFKKVIDAVTLGIGIITAGKKPETEFKSAYDKLLEYLKLLRTGIQNRNYQKFAQLEYDPENFGMYLSYEKTRNMNNLFIQYYGI